MDEHISKINFFSKKATFIPITDSNSGAILKKVIDNNKTYFLKIMPNNMNINKIKKIIEIYENCHINTIQLLEYGYIDNKLYLIYNFINGYALNNVYEKYKISDYYNMGFEVGQKYKKINTSCEINNIFEKSYSLEELINNGINSFLKLYNNDLSYIKKIIPQQKVQKLIKTIRELITSFDNSKKKYIHADMHPRNIMIDNDSNLYIIDIEAFCIDYFVMNIRWSIAEAFKSEKNNAFFKGFINGYYNNKISQNFNKQTIFVLILNFFEHVVEFSETKDKDFMINYVSKMNKILNSIDLSSNQNILFDNDLLKTCL